ncbi:MAG: hypothetical protein DRI34_03945 [Deltaproteobacteria bacterium]|nr:MAG: hypothetical protein DRI34_03945 [Deltaproteobacteria bacterium]
MGGVGVIVNRRAGKKTLLGGTTAQRLGALLGPADRLWQTDDPEQLPGVMEQFLQQGLGVLAIGGGDGSNHLVLSALLAACPPERLPRVAFLCGGTHNAHAASLGIRGRPVGLLRRLLQRLDSGRYLPVLRRIILRVEDGRRVHHGFSMATGFMYRFYRELLDHGGDSPLRVLGRLLGWSGDLLFGGGQVEQLFAGEPLHLSISGRALRWPEANGLACSSMEALGMGFRPFPLAGRYQDRFQVAASRVRARELLRIIGAFWKGREVHHPDIVVTTADDVLLQAEQPQGYVLDGELYQGGRRLHVSAGPRLALVRL